MWGIYHGIPCGLLYLTKEEHFRRNFSKDRWQDGPENNRLKKDKQSPKVR